MNDITLISLINIINSEDKIHVYLYNPLTGEINEEMSFYKCAKSPMAAAFIRVYAGYRVHEICSWEDGASGHIGVYIPVGVVNDTESEGK